MTISRAYLRELLGSLRVDCREILSNRLRRHLTGTVQEPMTISKGLFRELLIWLLYALSVPMYSIFGVTIFALGTMSLVLATRPGWPPLENLLAYGIPALAIVAGMVTLLQAVFCPAAYRSMWLADVERRYLLFAVVESFLCILIVLSALIFFSGLLSVLSSWIIGGLVRSEAINLPASSVLSVGLVILVGAQFLWGVVDLIQSLTEVDDADEIGEDG